TGSRKTTQFPDSGDGAAVSAVVSSTRKS
ncbi:hypothetical protein A2U01_0083498, partial [Trifolium medium]|nr:hypothetical protein [Trifolium medium]